MSTRLLFGLDLHGRALRFESLNARKSPVAAVCWLGKKGLQNLVCPALFQYRLRGAAPVMDRNLLPGQKRLAISPAVERCCLDAILLPLAVAAVAWCKSRNAGTSTVDGNQSVWLIISAYYRSYVALRLVSRLRTASNGGVILRWRRRAAARWLDATGCQRYSVRRPSNSGSLIGLPVPNDL